MMGALGGGGWNLFCPVSLHSNDVIPSLNGSVYSLSHTSYILAPLRATGTISKFFGAPRKSGTISSLRPSLFNGELWIRL